MKILTAEQMRRIDRLTVERTGISNRELMENAGRHVANFLLQQFPSPGRISILCGKGNNGGDALVAARHLLQPGHRPRVLLFASPADLKGDPQANYEAYLQAGGKVEVLPAPEEWDKQRSSVLHCDVLVDGLLGTGLSGPVTGYLAQVIADVNAHHRRYRVLAVDIPSGLPSDSGEPIAHKGHFGHVLLVAGSRGKTGAAALGGKAALRMGAGLSTVATAASALTTVASMVPEIMTEPLAETDSGSISRRAPAYR